MPQPAYKKEEDKIIVQVMKLYGKKSIVEHAKIAAKLIPGRSEMSVHSRIVKLRKLARKNPDSCDKEAIKVIEANKRAV